nr:winged helix-turn-helix domain-containing protein [Amycolatopsis endophytica]
MYDLGDEPGYVYEHMAHHLAERIERGDLRSGAPLPAERRLAAEYGVSLGTARHATQILRDWGLVFTVRSKGTYVSPRRTAPS